MEPALKIGLIVVYSAFSVIRIQYQTRAKRAGFKTVIEESKVYSVLLSTLICYEVLTFFIYLFAPQLLEWAGVPLHPILRWFGLVPAIAALSLFVWVHRHLGSNLSTRLRITDGHTMTAAGPYRWVRHPMYSAFVVLHVGAFLMTANWFIGATWMAGLAVVIMLRVRREEAMMLERFGDEYRHYMRRTGLLTPSLRVAYPRYSTKVK